VSISAQIRKEAQRVYAKSRPTLQPNTLLENADGIYVVFDEIASIRLIQPPGKNISAVSWSLCSLPWHKYYCRRFFPLDTDFDTGCNVTPGIKVRFSVRGRPQLNGQVYPFCTSVV
jgi:hypothetical protein